MPIPFILGALAVATGAYGIKKGLDAKENMDEAKRLDNDARSLVETTEKMVKNRQQCTKTAIEKLGNTKIAIASGSLNDFVESYSQIKNVSIKDSVGMDEIKNFNPDSQEFMEMKEIAIQGKELAGGGVGGVAAGAAMAFGAFHAVGWLGGTAGTGALISGLGGVAARNATLSWLGGGSLAAGGFGIQGGMIVLGGLVVGPALAVGGAFMSAKAEQALNDAKSNHDQARKFQQEGNNICTLLNAIEGRGRQLAWLLEELNRHFATSVEKMQSIIEMAGTDWKDYRETEKKEIGKAILLAKTVKTVLDTSLLREDGSLDPDSEKKVEYGNGALELLASGRM